MFHNIFIFNLFLLCKLFDIYVVQCMDVKMLKKCCNKVNLMCSVIICIKYHYILYHLLQIQFFS